MFRSLLRLPSPAFPADARTGDTRIDAYLETLDRELVGAVGIRRHTLVEGRDFLLESLETARAAGADEDQALREAIAGEQREARAKLFRTIAWKLGLGFATLMLGAALLGANAWNAMSWPLLIGGFAFNFAFFGGCMGYFYAYTYSKSMPADQDAPGPDTFLVHYTRLSIAMSWVLLLALGSVEVLLALGLAGWGPLRDWSTPMSVFLLLINLKTVSAAATSLRFHAVVSADMLLLTGIGGEARVRREQVVSLTVPSALSQLLWPGFGRAHRVTWRDDAGALRSMLISLNQDLVHGDRLIAWLESAARVHQAPTQIARHA
jgi:hypothetical protein